MPHDILSPELDASVKVSAFACITTALFNMLAIFPSFKLITESVRDTVVIPLVVVETMLPRSPTCLVLDVGAP